MTTSQVDTKHPSLAAMEGIWSTIDALMGGTEAMRKAGKRLLIQWPNETDRAFEARLRASTLYPAFKKTVSVLAGKPFSKDVAVSEEMPEQMRPWLEDVDQQRRNLDGFAAEVLECALSHGMSHILVDFPQNPKPGATTVAEERELGLRPYMVLVKATQLINWRATQRGALTQVRFYETYEEEDGDYGTNEDRQIRVLEPGRWAVFRRKRTSAGSVGSWELHENGTTTLNFIPFVTVYGKRKGLLRCRPPLEDLAELNVKHWNSQSDQDNILHIARVPILKVIGVDDTTFRLSVGAQEAVMLPPGGDLGYAEHSGAAVGVGKQALDDLKEEMRQAGAEMLVLRPGVRTATEVSTEEASGMSDLQRVVLGLQDGLNLAIEYMGRWAKIAKVGTVTVFNEFAGVGYAAETMPTVLQATTAGVLSKETAFHEMKRRSLIDPNLEWEDEQDKLESEGPPAGNVDPVTGLPYKEPAPPPSPDAAPPGGE